MYSDRDPGEADGAYEHGERPSRPAVRRLSAALGWVIAIAAIAAGVGWLYLLDRMHALDLGPHAKGALPLEELASRGAQPLARMVVAWAPAGFAATLALTHLARVRRVPAVVSVAALATVILFATTAASEALARNARLSEHLSPTLARSGLWVAVACVFMGSLAAAAVAGRRQPGAGAAANGAPGPGPAAA